MPVNQCITDIRVHREVHPKVCKLLTVSDLRGTRRIRQFVRNADGGVGFVE